MARIYFDTAASTPMDPRVLRAMKPYFLEEYGNPGSLHSYGQKAIGVMDASREAIARAIGAEFRDIVFTASATEANNLALRGVVGLYKKSASGASARADRPRIIISAIEHESVLETARVLEKDNVEIIYLPVTKEGFVDLAALTSALNKETILVSIMYVNNEIGTVQPIKEISKIISECRAQNKSAHYPLLHTDAAQAFQFFDCNVNELGVDLMTFSAHKIYGPKGIGVLYARRPGGKNIIEAQLAGGGQEFGLRSGTENVPSIVGFAKAVELAAAVREKEHARITKLREQLWQGIKKAVPRAEVNGEDINSSSAKISPHILNVYFPGHEAQDLLLKFDRAGIAVSTGSACRSRATEPSYVLQALGASKERASSSLRFSLGRYTAPSDIARAAKLFSQIFRIK